MKFLFTGSVFKNLDEGTKGFTCYNVSLWKDYLQAPISVSSSVLVTKKNEVNFLEIKSEHDLRKIIYQTQNEKK